MADSEQRVSEAAVGDSAADKPAEQAAGQAPHAPAGMEKKDEDAVKKKDRTQGGAREKKARKRHYLVFYVFILTLFISVGSVVFILGLFTSSGAGLFTTVPDVELPSFDQLTREEVENNEAYADFHINWQEEYSSEYKEGVIFDQSPKAPRQVKANATITLRVSMGVEKVTVPDILGWQRNSAREKVRSLGLQILLKTEENEEVDPGIVLRTEPSAGAQLESGDTLTVYISRDEVRSEAIVPSCVGLSREKANQILSNIGLTYRVVNVDSTQPEGTVLSQSPAAGSTLAQGGTVTLQISSGTPDAANIIVDGSGGIIYRDSEEAEDSTTGHHHTWQMLTDGHRVCTVCGEVR